MVFKVALRNLISNVRYSVMALLAIAGGFVSFVVFNGYIADSYRMIEEEIRLRMMNGDVIVEDARLASSEARSGSWKYLVSTEEQNTLSEIVAKSHYPIKTTARFLTLSGIVSNGKNDALIYGLGMDIEPAKIIRGPKWEWNVVAGVPLHTDGTLPTVVLGQGLAKLMGCQIPDGGLNTKAGEAYKPTETSFDCEKTKELQLSGMTVDNQINAVDVEISGITVAGLKELDRIYVMTSMDTAQTLMNTTSVGYIAVLLEDKRWGPALAKDINTQLAQKGGTLKAYHWMDHPIAGALYRQSKELLTIFQVFIVTVILVIVGLSVFNTFVKIVLERTREVGTMRSMGFSRGQIRQFFLVEASLLALAGSFLGALLSLGLTMAISFAGITYQAGLFQNEVPLNILIVGRDYLLGSAFMFILAWAATYFALRMTLRRRIVDNLNHA